MPEAAQKSHSASATPPAFAGDGSPEGSPASVRASRVVNNMRLRTIAIIGLLLLAVPLFGQQVDLSKAPDAKIMIPIKVQTAQGEFNDSIYCSAAEFNALTAAQITAAKKARSDNWVAYVVAASKQIPKEPTAAELIEQQDEQLKRMDALLLKLSTTGTKADLQAVAAKLKLTTDTLAVSISKATAVIEKGGFPNGGQQIHVSVIK